jgi:colicin import membrane protein
VPSTKKEPAKAAPAQPKAAESLETTKEKNKNDDFKDAMFVKAQEQIKAEKKAMQEKEEREKAEKAKKEQEEKEKKEKAEQAEKAIKEQEKAKEQAKKAAESIASASLQKNVVAK